MKCESHQVRSALWFICAAERERAREWERERYREREKEENYSNSFCSRRRRRHFCCHWLWKLTAFPPSPPNNSATFQLIFWSANTDTLCFWPPPQPWSRLPCCLFAFLKFQFQCLVVLPPLLDSQPLQNRYYFIHAIVFVFFLASTSLSFSLLYLKNRN